MPKDGSFPIIWDSHTSISVTNDKADFLTFTKVSLRHNNVMGVAQGLKFSGFGEVLWSFLDEKGMLRSFKLPALYIPSTTTRLLSTTSLLQSYSGELIEQTGHGMRLSGTSDGQRNTVEATINPNNNLPTSTGYSYGKVMEAANTLVNMVVPTPTLDRLTKSSYVGITALATLACGKCSSSCKLAYWPPPRPPGAYTPPPAS